MTNFKVPQWGSPSQTGPSKILTTQARQKNFQDW